MKRLSLLAFIICAILISFATAKNMSLKLSGTAIDEYIAQNPDLPDFDKACLMSGEYRVGIQAGTLKLLLGEPRKVSRIKQPWGEQEEWFYKVDGNMYFIIENGGVVGIEERKR